MNLDLQMPGDVTHLITNEHAGLQRAAFEALALECTTRSGFPRDSCGRCSGSRRGCRCMRS
jgi:hypothetical protein